MARNRKELKDGTNVQFVTVNKGFTAFALILLVLVAVVVIQHFYYESKASKREQEFQEQLAEAESPETTFEVTDEITVTTATLRSVVQSARELISYKYYYTDVGEYESSQKFFDSDIKIPFTTDKQVYTYSGIISVGVDLNDVAFEVDQERRQILVTMPQVKVIAHEMEEDKFQSYDVKKSVFTKTDLKDFADFVDGLKKEQEQKLSGNQGFWEDARRSMEAAIRDLLTVSAEIGDYGIVFEE